MGKQKRSENTYQKINLKKKLYTSIFSLIN